MRTPERLNKPLWTYKHHSTVHPVLYYREVSINLVVVQKITFPDKRASICRMQWIVIAPASRMLPFFAAIVLRKTLDS